MGQLDTHPDGTPIDRHDRAAAMWVAHSQLDTAERYGRAAAMWAAEEARRGLRMVEAGEEKTMEGWLIYGAALNEGRKLYPKGDNERFGIWMDEQGLRAFPTRKLRLGDDDRAAAMWAAGNPEQFQETHKAHPRVRTIRGLLAGHQGHSLFHRLIHDFQSGIFTTIEPVTDTTHRMAHNPILIPLRSLGLK